MSRSVAWQRSASDAVNWRQDQALNATIYILREVGPTSFLLKEDGQVKKFKVSLGDPHVCSCADFKNERSPCKHVCWLLLKKFKLDRQDELSYQLGLVEREINQVLRNPAKVEPLPQAASIEQPHNINEGKKELEQRPLGDEDVCPICQETLLTKRQPVTYCRYGCGNSVHIKCMKVWVDHQRQSSNSDVITCPFCRGEFASPKLLALEFRNTLHENKMTSDKLDIHAGVLCNCCKMNPIKGKCYRCDTCDNFHLCNTCFHNKQHILHAFVFRLKKTQRWRSAPSRDQHLYGETLLSPVVNELQNRELTENDYDLLLQLDRPLETSSTVPVDLAGLPDHVINRLPMSKVKVGSRLLAPGRQCRLCLHSYTPGQLIRRLPECGHIFHRQCIDEWLSKDHRRCPVDRTLVVVPKTRSKQELSHEGARGGPETSGGEGEEMVVPGVGLIHFAPGAVAPGRSKTSSVKQRIQLLPLNHSSLIDVTMSDLLIQADAICINNGANRIMGSQAPHSLAENQVVSAPSFDSVLPKIVSQKRLDGKSEVVKRARFRNFAKKSDWKPCSDLFDFSLNGTQVAGAAIQDQVLLEAPKSSGDAITSTLNHPSVDQSSRSKTKESVQQSPAPARRREAVISRNKIALKPTEQEMNQNKSEEFSESESLKTNKRRQRNFIGSHSAPPLLVSKQPLK